MAKAGKGNRSAGGQPAQAHDVPATVTDTPAPAAPATKRKETQQQQQQQFQQPVIRQEIYTGAPGQHHQVQYVVPEIPGMIKFLRHVVDYINPREAQDLITLLIKPTIAKWGSVGFSIDNMGDVKTDLNALARNLGLSFEEAAQKLTRDDDTRLGLQARYQKRLREIELPEGGFTTKAQVAAADRLAATYRQLRAVQTDLEKPEAVARAEALASAYRRSHDKTSGAAIPVRRVGRPRKTGSERRSSSSP
jgi:hypothetical protein